MPAELNQLSRVLNAAFPEDKQIEALKAQVDKAVNGDLKALEFLFAYVHGKPKNETTLSGSLSE